MAEMLTYSSGTGFFAGEGYVVTNYHVIEHCKEITVSGPVPLSAAALVALDAAYDLALLKTPARAAVAAKLASARQPLRVGDPVTVVGYPGQSWQTQQTQTREASILKTQGPRGEEQWLEFSDALAKGNSGGPLLDASGNVVGVVAAKGKLMRGDEKEPVETFDIAISLPVLREFLAQHAVAYGEADSGIYQTAGRITEDARRFVVNVRCRVEPAP